MIDNAWLAGYIDGDGCISVRRFRRNNSYQYMIQVDVSGTNYSLLSEIQKTWGGWLCENKRPKGNRAFQYRVVWGNNKALSILKQVFPFLRLKRDEAALAIDFQKNRLHLSNKQKEAMYQASKLIKQSYKVFAPPAETKRSSRGVSPSETIVQATQNT